MRVLVSAVLFVSCTATLAAGQATAPPATSTPSTTPGPPTTPSVPTQPTVPPTPGVTTTPPGVGTAPGQAPTPGAATMPATPTAPPGAAAPPGGTPPPSMRSAPGRPATPGAPIVNAPLNPAPTPPDVPGEITSRVLTLDDAVAIALQRQPKIQAFITDYAAARFRVDEALSPLRPQVTALGTATKSKNLFISGPTPTVISRNFDQTLIAEVVVSQLLFDFGKTFATTEAARRLADSAFESIELQRQLITLAVKQQYTNINFAVRLIKVQEQALERAELNLRQAQGFFEVGTRPKFEVTRAEVDVANARVDLIRARNAEQLARVALDTAMGLPPTTPLTIQDNLVFQPAVLDAAALYAEALRQRPEARQARLNVDVAQANYRRTVRDFFPDVTGGGLYGGASKRLDEIWQVNLSLSWTLYDGGNRIARYREAKALVESAQSRVKGTELDISNDVEQARLSAMEAQERIQAAGKAVASAQENFRLARGRFEAGVGTIIELTDAQLTLVQAQNTEAMALADYRNFLSALDRAVGRR